MGTWRNRNLARLRAKEQVGGSNPPVLITFLRLRSSTGIKSTRIRLLRLRVQILPKPFRIWIFDFRFWFDIPGSSNGRTHRFERWNRGSNPLPEANFFCAQPSGFEALVLGTRRREERISPRRLLFLGVPQMAIRACFGNKCSQVRILLPRLVLIWNLRSQISDSFKPM